MPRLFVCTQRLGEQGILNGRYYVYLIQAQRVCARQEKKYGEQKEENSGLSHHAPGDLLLGLRTHSPSGGGVTREGRADHNNNCREGGAGRLAGCLWPCRSPTTQPHTKSSKTFKKRSQNCQESFWTVLCEPLAQNTFLVRPGREKQGREAINFRMVHTRQK